jgi:hypothetical protein
MLALNPGRFPLPLDAAINEPHALSDARECHRGYRVNTFVKSRSDSFKPSSVKATDFAVLIGQLVQFRTGCSACRQRTRALVGADGLEPPTFAL